MGANAKKGGVFFPQDIDLLEGAFKRLCHAARLDRKGPDAGVIAANLFSQFQDGCQTHNALVHGAAVSDEYRSTVAKRLWCENNRSFSSADRKSGAAVTAPTAPVQPDQDET